MADTASGPNEQSNPTASDAAAGEPGKPKTAAQLKKEAKRLEKLEKFKAKQEKLTKTENDVSIM